MQKRTIITLAIVAASVVAVLVWKRRHPDAPRKAPETPGATVPAAPKEAASPAQPASPGSASRVRRLGKEERKQLGEQINRAVRRARTGSSAPAPTSGADEDIPQLVLEQVATQVKDALVEAIPLVAKCYEGRPKSERELAARMTMISDPDLGTVVDTEAISDRNGKPVDPVLDDCMRDVIDSLALPTLGQPGQLKVEFTFSDD